MQSFKEFIEESFDAAPAKWKLIEDSDIDSIYRFTIDNSVYTVFFKISMREKHPVEVTFGVMNPKTHEMEFEMSGTGNQYRVLMTVLDTIKDFIARRDPPGLFITAMKKISDAHKDSKSRADVYRKMIQKFLPDGWSFTTSENRRLIDFILTKND